MPVIQSIDIADVVAHQDGGRPTKKTSFGAARRR